MVLIGNHPLFGPAPAEMLDPVPHEDLLRAIVEGVPGLLAELDFARIWATFATGQILSKDAAAGWALGNLPEDHRAVLARARAIYVGMKKSGGTTSCRVFVHTPATSLPRSSGSLRATGKSSRRVRSAVARVPGTGAPERSYSTPPGSSG